jgi:hypothetical protein
VLALSVSHYCADLLSSSTVLLLVTVVVSFSLWRMTIIMTTSNYRRLSANEIELPKLSSPHETDGRSRVDDSESSIKAFASNSVPQSTFSSVDNGKSRYLARGETASLQTARNERMHVGNAWNPGTWARFPWAGLGALILVVARRFWSKHLKAVELGSSPAARARFCIPRALLAVTNHDKRSHRSSSRSSSR